jgi:hypothetical protein
MSKSVIATNPPAPTARNPIICVTLPGQSDRIKLTTFGRMYTWPRTYQTTEASLARVKRLLAGAEPTGRSNGVKQLDVSFAHLMPVFAVMWQCSNCRRVFTDSVNYGEYLCMSADDVCADCCELQPITE